MNDSLPLAAERTGRSSAAGHPGQGTTNQRERIALITPWHPEPVDNGSKQRIRQLIAALAEAYDVVLISLLTQDQRGTTTPPAVPGVWRSVVLPIPAYEPRSSRALLAALQPIPRSFAATWDRATAAALNRILRHLHVRVAIGADLRVLQYVAALPPNIPTLIDEANTSPFLVQEEEGGRLIPRLRAATRRSKYSRLLRDAMTRVDTAIVSSPQEARAYRLLSGSSRIAVIENGVGIVPEPKWCPPVGARLLYAGSLTYAPNADAVAYFAGSILPHIEQEIAEVQLLVTGTLPPLTPSGVAHPRVELTGWLDRATLDKVYRQCRACVIPLRSGTGTRIKVLEAMALGIPVVSTTKGVEGLAVVPGEEFLLADTPAEFATACTRLLTDATLAEAVGERGREKIRREYTWESRGRHLRELVRECLSRAPLRRAS